MVRVRIQKTEADELKGVLSKNRNCVSQEQIFASSRTINFEVEGTLLEERLFL